MALNSLRLRARIYEKANLLTGILVLFLVTTALIVTSYDGNPSIFILPGLLFVSFVVVLFTDSAFKFLGNLMCYVVIAGMCAVVATVTFPYSPTGILPGIWVTSILAGSCGTLALSYFIKNSSNKHFLAMLSSLLNVSGAMLGLYAVSFFADADSTAKVADVMIKLVVASFVVSMCIVTGIIVWYAHSYSWSFFSSRVVNKDFATMEYSSILGDIKHAVKKNDYTVKEYTSHGKKNAFAYKDNKSIVFIPLSIAFEERDMGKSLPRNAKTPHGAFENIIASIVYKYGGVFALPAVPIVVVFVVQRNSLKRTVKHSMSRGGFGDVVFVPRNRLHEWVSNIDATEKRSRNSKDLYAAIFPELSDRDKEYRDNFDFDGSKSQEKKDKKKSRFVLRKKDKNRKTDGTDAVDSAGSNDDNADTSADNADRENTGDSKNSVD